MILFQTAYEYPKSLEFYFSLTRLYGFGPIWGSAFLKILRFTLLLPRKSGFNV